MLKGGALSLLAPRLSEHRGENILTPHQCESANQEGATFLLFERNLGVGALLRRGIIIIRGQGPNNNIHNRTSEQEDLNGRTRMSGGAVVDPPRRVVFQGRAKPDILYLPNQNMKRCHHILVSVGESDILFLKP